jgi:hypothetical protein
MILGDTCNVSKSWISPVVTMLPAWWRFLQCLRRFHDTKLWFPHLINAGKYFCSIIVIWLSATQNITDNWNVRVVWITFSVLATFYSYMWDIMMDWGFLQKNSKHFLLRDDLIYEWRWIYYWAMVSNLALRVSWYAFKTN